MPGQDGGRGAGTAAPFFFVSHNMQAVRSLCGRAIELEAGRIIRAGDTQEVTDAYLRGSLQAETVESIESALKALPPQPGFSLDNVEVRQDGIPSLRLLSGRPVEIEFRYSISEPTRWVRAFFDLLDDDQNLLFRSHHNDEEPMMPMTEPGTYVSVATIPSDLLAPRNYRLRVAMHKGRWAQSTGDGEGILIPVSVEATSGINQAYGDTVRWKLQPRIPWQTTRLTDDWSTSEEDG